MPIRQLLDKTSFGPEDIKVLVSAFGDALRELGVERTDAAATALAKRVIALAQQGERDFQTTISDVFGQSLRAREGECELGTLAIGKRCQERISATGWAW
jgi:hypothetical protein